ncbi:hypothetical protein F53441_4722 [Fusarium austroafricanum]|uniref:Uncharacterized protein n=1 Tax=Fusarium austroafricanum TaxID=2364996 RepID=A0A8H4KLE2_9HYPO|nr:hypothetical protein F53441_4722 [Fusarium austroafricanum]
MKTTFFNVALALTAISTAVANPAPMQMGVDIQERDGVLEVREVLAFSAESAFISVAAAPLEMEAAMLLSMLAADGVATTASLDASEMDRLVSSGASK